MNTWPNGRLLNCDVLSCLALSVRGESLRPQVMPKRVDIFEVFLVSIEGIAPDVAPPDCFAYFRVSLWPFRGVV